MKNIWLIILALIVVGGAAWYFNKNYLAKIDSSRKSLYIESGSEFRQFIKGKNRTQVLSSEINSAGKLQPEFLAVYMWTNILVREYSGSEHLIFDGMPRKFHA